MRYALMALCAVGGFAVAAWLQTWWVILLVALALFIVAGVIREGAAVR